MPKTLKARRSGAKFVSRAEFAKAPSDSVLLRKSYDTNIEPGEGETRALRFTISTSGIDRDNDIITAAGWDLKNYLKTPVVLWAHQYDQLPVGKAHTVKVDGDRLVAEVEFVPAEVYPFAETVFRMLKGGFLGGTSVGFKPKTFKFNEKRQGFDFAEQELLEFSVVPIPANPDALLDARAAGIVDDGDIERYADWARKYLADVKAARKEPDIAEASMAPLPTVTVDGLTQTTAWKTPVLKDFTVKPWADLSSGERRTVAGHYAWASEFPPETFGGLDFPHHDPATGKVVWAGLVAAMGTLLHGDNDTIPAPQRKQIYDHLAQHFQAFKATPPAFAALAEPSDVWLAMLSPEALKGLPTPADEEGEQDFVSRCMGSEAIGQEFPKEDQRAAICYAQYRRGKSQKVVVVPKGMDGCPKGDACPMTPGMEYCPAGDDCPMKKGAPAKTEPIEVTKIGRVLASRNETRLRQAATLLTEVLAELDIAPVEPKAETPPVEKVEGDVQLVLDGAPITKAVPPPTDDELPLSDLSAADLGDLITRTVQSTIQQHKRSTTGELD